MVGPVEVEELDEELLDVVVAVVDPELLDEELELEEVVAELEVADDDDVLEVELGAELDTLEDGFTGG